MEVVLQHRELERMAAENSPGGESREMKAMILAAGLGTRLRPLTDDRPKALVEVAGHTMLEITLRRLASFGIRDVIVNVHHSPIIVIDYLKKNDNFGMRIEISREDILLDTGGGLKKAAWFFQEGDSRRAVHPAQCRCDQHHRSCSQWCKFIRKVNALATLAVQERETSRYLLFDRQNRALRPARGPRSESMRLFDRRAEMSAPRILRHPCDFVPGFFR